MNGKKSIPLTIAMVLGVAYTVYSIWYWYAGGAAAQAGSDAASQLGGALAVSLATPHVVAAIVAAVFNVLAWVMGKRGFALVAGILYAVALVLFPMYFMFVIIQMVLCFVAFARMRGASHAASHS